MQPCRITRTHFPDFEPDLLSHVCSVISKEVENTNSVVWFDSISDRTRLPTEASTPSITQQRLFNCTPFQEHLTSQLVFGGICVARSRCSVQCFAYYCLSFFSCPLSVLQLAAPGCSLGIFKLVSITLQGKFKEDKLTYFPILFFLPLNSSI